MAFRIADAEGVGVMDKMDIEGWQKRTLLLEGVDDPARRAIGLG
jgi:hypothetical protein